jgi:hypothetical protein
LRKRQGFFVEAAFAAASVESSHLPLAEQLAPFAHDFLFWRKFAFLFDIPPHYRLRCEQIGSVYLLVSSLCGCLPNVDNPN